jgi:glycine betaine catabolism B
MHVLSEPRGIDLPQRHTFRFLESRTETPTVRTFRFSTEGTGFRYRSNQAIRLLLPGVLDPRGPARSFSLASSPSEPGIAEVSVKMTGSPFKEALRSLRPGDTALAIGPLGDLLYDPSRDSLFIAGGIGASPFRGMIRFARDLRKHRPIRMLYSARTPEEFAFRRELDDLARSDGGIEVRYTVTRPDQSEVAWTGRTGRIDAAWIREALERLERPKVFVVGVPEMAVGVLELMRNRFGVSEEDLEYEFFRGYSADTPVPGPGGSARQ